MTSLKKPAPDSILNLISCSCSGDLATGKCSCRKSGLNCSDMCKNCIGGECLNLKTFSPESVNNLDDDDLDDALQGINDDSDMETCTGKIICIKKIINKIFFLNKFV